MFENIHVMTQLLQKTCIAAWPVVAVFMFFSFLIVILFGCIIFILEQGTFTVNADYPHGAYIRLALNHHDYEVSPFVSIGTSFYWVIVTGATVGYGDLAPTTYAGRALASMTCIFGILGWLTSPHLLLSVTLVPCNYPPLSISFNISSNNNNRQFLQLSILLIIPSFLMFYASIGLAFPVGVLGSEFTRVFNAHYERLRARIVEKKRLAKQTAALGKSPTLP